MILVFPSELGWFAIRGTGGFLCQVRFGYADQHEALAALGPDSVDGVLAASAAADCDPVLSEVARRLADYAAGGRPDFRDVPVDLSRISDFRRRVLSACRAIPHGETRGYGQLAAEVGRPGAARAVGGAMAANPCPIVIPCHRVIGSTGRLTGFSGPGGIGLKQRLLDWERGVVKDL